MGFGQKLLEFRAKYNLTQNQLAAMIGVHPNMVFRYENNLSNPSAVNQIKFDKKIKEWEEKNV